VVETYVRNLTVSARPVSVHLSGSDSAVNPAGFPKPVWIAGNNV